MGVWDPRVERFGVGGVAVNQGRSRVDDCRPGAGGDDFLGSHRDPAKSHGPVRLLGDGGVSDVTGVLGRVGAAEVKFRSRRAQGEGKGPSANLFLGYEGCYRAMSSPLKFKGEELTEERRCVLSGQGLIAHSQESTETSSCGTGDSRGRPHSLAGRGETSDCYSVLIDLAGGRGAIAVADSERSTLICSSTGRGSIVLMQSVAI